MLYILICHPCDNDRLETILGEIHRDRFERYYRRHYTNINTYCFSFFFSARVRAGFRVRELRRRGQNNVTYFHVVRILRSRHIIDVIVWSCPYQARIQTKYSGGANKVLKGRGF